MRLFVIFLFMLPAWAAQSIHLEHGKTGTATVPAYTNAAQFRVEFRMDNRTLASGGAYVNGIIISNMGGFHLQRGDSGTDAVCTHLPSGLFQKVPVTETMNFEVRMRRQVTTPGSAGTWTCEAWDMETPGSPTKIVSLSISVTHSAVTAGSLTIGPVCTITCGDQANSSYDLAYLRVFSTPGSFGGTAPASSPAIGDIFNYEFNGATNGEIGADTHLESGQPCANVGACRNINWNANVTNCPAGGGTTVCTLTTPTLPVGCDAGTTQIVRAGETLTASAAGSYSLNEGPLTSYGWSVIEYPAATPPEVIGNSTSVTLNLRNTVFGQYTLQVEVADASSSATCTVIHGVVAQTSDGIVIYPSETPSAIKTLLGPTIVHGKNPLEWMDFSLKASADKFDERWGTFDGAVDRSGYWDDDPQNWASGTVNITQSNTTTGTGTANDPSFTVNCTTPGTCQFRSTVCNASGVIAAGMITSVFIHYPAYQGGYGPAVQGGYAAGVPMPSGETGWLKANVASCPSDNQMILSWNQFASPGPINIGAPKGTAINGRNWSYFVRPAVGVTNPIQAWSAAAPTAVDFYDSALGYYGMYFRTGLTKYLTRARYITDRHYSNAVNMNKGLPYRIGVDCGPGATAATTCLYNEGDGQDPRDGNFTSVMIRALDGKPEYWTGIRRVCGYYENSPFYAGGAGDREHGYALMFLSTCALADPDPTFHARWMAELTRQIDGFSSTVCTETNETTGSNKRPCHGRWKGQWVQPTSSTCPGAYGLASHQSCGDFTKPNWAVRMTNGSNVATMLNGALTTPPGNDFLKPPAEVIEVPISFGPDQTLGPLCVASGAVGSMTCGTTPPTTSYTAQMIIVLRPPTTITGVPGPTPFINVDGLGTKQIVTSAGGTSWTANSYLTAGMDWAIRYDGTRFVQIPMLAIFYPITEPNTATNVTGDIAKAFIWPERLTSTTFRMKEYSVNLNRAAVPNYTWNSCNPGPTCDLGFRWDFAVNIGGRVQPFMQSIIMFGLDTAYEATVANGTPDSRIPPLISEAAKWMVDYAYDPLTGGLYFARNGAACEAESAYGVMPATINLLTVGSFTPLTSCLSDQGGARAMAAEVGRAMSKAYVRESDATRKANIKTWTQKVMAKAYGKPGYACAEPYTANCGDGYYFVALEETYLGGISTEYDKYLGFAIGFGGGHAWPAAELHTEWPRVPPARTASMSFRFASIPGTTTVTVTLRDQHGTTLTPVDCASSPCSVPVPDGKAGDYQYQASYRSGATTLAASEWQRLSSMN